MQEHLFLLNFENWDTFLFSIIPVCINLGIFFYISLFLNQSKTNQLFCLFVLLLAISQGADAFIRISGNIETAALWNRLSLPPLCLALPLGLFFSLRFTGWYKKIHNTFIILFLLFPAIIIELIVIARQDEYKIVKSERWTWLPTPESDFFTISTFLWISLTTLCTLVILWLYYIKEKKEKRKKIQALLLATGYTVPVTCGLITEVAFPLLLKINSIPLSTPAITIFSITTLIALKKYQLFDFSPKHQWNKIIEHMSEGVLIVDNSDKIMYANKAFCTFMEYEFSEIQGKLDHELFSENFEYKKQVDRLKNKEVVQYEVQKITKSGSKIWMLVNNSPYLDNKGNVIGSIRIQTNINHLKEAENIIKQNEQRLTQAQGVAHVGSWELLFETGYSIWSEEACRIYGLLPSDNKHSFESWLSFIHPEDIDLVKQEVEKSTTHLRDASFEHRIICKDNTIKLIHSVSKIQFDDLQKPIGLVGICHDITERKKSEEKLKIANQELETYIYKASHDLKAPLASILGLIQIGKKEIKDQASTKFIDLIDTMTKRLHSMLSELIKSMAIKDTESFNDEIKFQELINETLTTFKYTKDFSRLKIFTSILVSSPFFSNKFIFQTIFQNIIGNAIKYQNFNLQESFLKITVTQQDKKVIIVFEDNGIGIEETQQQKIFEMYYRASQQSSGSGLGLYLIKKGIEKLNGEIYVQSILGKGTTFTVTLTNKK